MTDTQAPGENGERLIVALFAQEQAAQKAIERLNQADFPMDMISVLGHGQSSGDDLLGLYYPGVGERMRGWGRAGAFWGGLWGLLTGAAGMFLVPGVGPLLAAGPVVGALAAAAAGAGLTGGVMAGAAAVTQLAVALHRSGVPEERLEDLQQALVEGNYLVLLRAGGENVERWLPVLWHAGARDTRDYPYRGVADAVRHHEPEQGES